MLNEPLVIPKMLERAEKLFYRKKIISRTQNCMHELTYEEVGKRTRRLASALWKLGITRGDRIGTFAWNHHRHLEAYFAIPSIGAVLHTINIRLSPEHICYSINHARDSVLFVDVDLLQAIENIRDRLLTVKAIIVMTDEPHLPKTSLENVYHYDQLLETGDAHFQFLEDIQEDDSAGMYFINETTGNPKGVLYSHREVVLQSIALGLADMYALGESDVFLPVVPMFHVNAWGFLFACTWFGSTQVLPGPLFTPKMLAALIQEYGVTLVAGGEQIWTAFLREIEEKTYDMHTLRGIICGESISPFSMIRTYEEKYSIPFMHAYEMTKTSQRNS